MPVVRCLPLRACDLALEAGEVVAGWALGDTERWLTDELTEGTGSTARVHLLVKPTDFDVATNLVVVTDRRTYHLELESPSYGEVHDDSADGPATAYDGAIRWWYPDQLVRRARAKQAEAEKAAAHAATRHEQAVSLDLPVDPAHLCFDYTVKRPWRRSRRLPWEPRTVFDDGRQVYLRLPDEARRSELPVILGLLEDGKTYPLNARIDGDWLIVPTLFERAELLLGTGDQQRSLTVVATKGL